MNYPDSLCGASRAIPVAVQYLYFYASHRGARLISQTHLRSPPLVCSVIIPTISRPSPRCESECKRRQYLLALPRLQKSDKSVKTQVSKNPSLQLAFTFVGVDDFAPGDLQRTVDRDFEGRVGGRRSRCIPRAAAGRRGESLVGLLCPRRFRDRMGTRRSRFCCGVRAGGQGEGYSLRSVHVVCLYLSSRRWSAWSDGCGLVRAEKRLEGPSWDGLVLVCPYCASSRAIRVWMFILLIKVR